MFFKSFTARASLGRTGTKPPWADLGLGVGCVIAPFFASRHASLPGYTSLSTPFYLPGGPSRRAWVFLVPADQRAPRHAGPGGGPQQPPGPGCPCTRRQPGAGGAPPALGRSGGPGFDHRLRGSLGHAGGQSLGVERRGSGAYVGCSCVWRRPGAGGPPSPLDHVGGPWVL